MSYIEHLKHWFSLDRLESVCVLRQHPWTTKPWTWYFVPHHRLLVHSVCYKQPTLIATHIAVGLPSIDTTRGLTHPTLPSTLYGSSYLEPAKFWSLYYFPSCSFCCIRLHFCFLLPTLSFVPLSMTLPCARLSFLSFIAIFIG